MGGGVINDVPTFRKPTPAEFKEAASLSIEHRHARLPAETGRVSALNGLHARLASNAALYEQGDLQDQRDAVADSLIAVQKCLRSMGFALATLAPIMRPAQALVERENNSLDPMFCERARIGRPNATISEHERIGILAAIAEVWLAIHRDDEGTQKQKLSRLSRILVGPWFGKITPSKLKTARDLVLQEAKDHLAVQHAQLYYSMIVKTAETSGAEIAIQIMVRFLNDTPATFGVGKPPISKTPHISPSDDD
jgi:hypothetical protein